VGIQDQIHLAIKLEINAQAERPLNLGEALTKVEMVGGRPGQFIYRLTFAEEVRITPIPKS